MSNAINYVDIANALALRFSATNVTAPTGEPALRSSTTHIIPAGIHPPCVVIFGPEEPVINYYPGMMVTTTQLWRVQFYLAVPGDYGRVNDKLLKWRNAIYAALDAHIQLGLDYINEATVTNVSGPGELPYGDARGTPDAPGYPGLVLTVEVKTRDARTFVS